MTTATLPDLKGLETYYGLQVSDIGEDGTVIILGHHHHDPLRVVAALNRHARTFWGCANLLDDTGKGVADLSGSLSETYAVALNSCGSPERPHDCQRCRELSDADWWIEWNHAADDPDAFPVTMWRP